MTILNDILVVLGLISDIISFMLVLLGALIAIFMLIPGPEPERTLSYLAVKLQDFTNFIHSRSRK